MNFDMKVMVIDDMPTMVKIISRMLQNIGFKNIKTGEIRAGHPIFDDWE